VRFDVLGSRLSIRLGICEANILNTAFSNTAFRGPITTACRAGAKGSYIIGKMAGLRSFLVFFNKSISVQWVV